MKAKNINAAILTCLFLSACSPYNRLLTRPPLNDKDTLHLSARCTNTFPIRITETITILTDTLIDTEAMELLADQLRTALSLLERCQDAKGQAINLDSFRIAVVGQLQADYRPETIYRTEYRERIIKDSAEAVMWRKLHEEKVKALERAQAVMDKQKETLSEVKEGRRKWTWYAIITWLLIGAYIFGRFKRIIK